MLSLDLQSTLCSLLHWLIYQQLGLSIWPIRSAIVSLSCWRPMGERISAISASLGGLASMLTFYHFFWFSPLCLPHIIPPPRRNLRCLRSSYRHFSSWLIYSSILFALWSKPAARSPVLKGCRSTLNCLKNNLILLLKIPSWDIPEIKVIWRW